MNDGTTVAGWPRWARVRQTFPGTPVHDFEAAVADALRQLNAAAKVKPGDRVAITSGSRGVANVVPITRAAVTQIRHLGGEPWVLPCMGSHGGATPDGQFEVLRSYGVTEASVGAPVISQGEVVQIGSTDSGLPLWVDRLAAESDHILVINRVKPHTDFSSKVFESGPTKMLAIGIGKHSSASTCHQQFVTRGYEPVLREVGAALWQRLPMLGGLGPVENGHHQTVALGAVRPDQHEADEAKLLRLSKDVFGYLPFDTLDVLIVDAIGKDVSGTGMDTNVTGMDVCRIHQPPDTPRILRILVRGLTPDTHGNATGIGNADFALRRCVEAIDWQATATNVLTASGPEVARCPLVFDTDRAMLTATFSTTGPTPTDQLRLVRIADTLRVDDILASEALLAAVHEHPRCEVIGEPGPLRLNDAGFLAEPAVSDGG